MICLIQQLDPTGVGAQDLRECHLIQIAQSGEDMDFEYRLVADHMDALLENHAARGTRVLIDDARHIESGSNAELDVLARCSGSSQEQDAEPPAADSESVFDPLTETLDRAQGVEETLRQNAEELRRRIEEDEN